MATESNPTEDDHQLVSSQCPTLYTGAPTKLLTFPQELLEKIFESIDDNSTQLICRQVHPSLKEAVDSFLRHGVLTKWISRNLHFDKIIPTLRLTMEPENDYELVAHCLHGASILQTNSCPTNSLRIKREWKVERAEHHLQVSVLPFVTNFSNSLSALSLIHINLFPGMLVRILERVPYLRALELSSIALKTETVKLTLNLPVLAHLTFLKLKKIRSLVEKDVSACFYGYITEQLLELQLDGVSYPALGTLKFSSIKGLKSLSITTPTREFLRNSPGIWLKKLSLTGLNPADEITHSEMLSFLGKFSQSLVELHLEPFWFGYKPPTAEDLQAPLRNFQNLRNFTVTYPEYDLKGAVLIRDLMEKFGKLVSLHFYHVVYHKSDLVMDAQSEREKMMEFLVREAYWNKCPDLVSIDATVSLFRPQDGTKIRIWEREN